MGKRGPKGIGRPTKYQGEDHDRIAFGMALLGATDAQIADALGVTEQTVNNWKKAHPSFFESLKIGKDEADAKVADSLYQRARGYEHEEDKIFCNASGEVTTVRTVKHYPPDTTACIFWLKNRQTARWRDRHELVTLTPEQVADLTDEQLSGILSGQAVDETKPVN
jgi:predicted transcriptional regulator